MDAISIVVLKVFFQKSAEVRTKFPAETYFLRAETLEDEAVLDHSIKLTVQPEVELTIFDYRCERMWSTQQQPWYFTIPADVATDLEGNIYVVDSNLFANYRQSPGRMPQDS